MINVCEAYIIVSEFGVSKCSINKLNLAGCVSHRLEINGIFSNGNPYGSALRISQGFPFGHSILPLKSF